jgi:serine phosphatase RsbU (regulator of sigma subunit)/anti-sigma regulatory factor (Ser/Thr protein kinase)
VRLRRVAVRSAPTEAAEAFAKVGTLTEFAAGTPYAQCLDSGEALPDPDASEVDAAWTAVGLGLAAGHPTTGPVSWVTVPLRARDTALGLAHFCRFGPRDPFTPQDRELVEDLASCAAVCLDNARRYTDETRAMTELQDALLRDVVPMYASTAHARRYLPGRLHRGRGGSWCDVIALSGARVALIVGDATGHGVKAVARAGRARATLRALAGLDLAPEELFTYFDRLVRRAVETQLAAGEPEGVLPTCLYLVYDPTTGRCDAVSAGHPPPVLAAPGQPAQLLDMPVGPPLGSHGLPFEAAGFDLPDDSVLALYTSGLLGPPGAPASRRFLHALAGPQPSLDALADAATHAALTGGSPEEDTVLLLVRTSPLAADRVASWDLPADPPAVAPARHLAARQLATWGVDNDAAEVTELVVSELVTNAIRYGTPPIRLRLIHDRALTCEVTDASSTSPHLRHAATNDEGGRGLFLISQLADAWGTRYTPHGKTIWTEQRLDATPTTP